MVPETLAPTKTAPRNSQMAASTHACRMVSERDATDVANELDVSDRRHSSGELYSLCDIVSTDVVRVERRKQETDRKDVVVLVERRHRFSGFSVMRRTTSVCCFPTLCAHTTGLTRPVSHDHSPTHTIGSHTTHPTSATHLGAFQNQQVARHDLLAASQMLESIIHERVCGFWFFIRQVEGV